MTRADFDRLYAARMDNTEGYTQRQLDIINTLAFVAVEHLDPDERSTKSIVDFALERASTHWEVFDALERASIHYEVAQS
jgi:hypothetical protein